MPSHTRRIHSDITELAGGGVHHRIACCGRIGRVGVERRHRRGPGVGRLHQDHRQRHAGGRRPHRAGHRQLHRVEAGVRRPVGGCAHRDARRLELGGDPHEQPPRRHQERTRLQLRRSRRRGRRGRFGARRARLRHPRLTSTDLHRRDTTVTIAYTEAVVAQLASNLRREFEELATLNTQLKNQVDQISTQIWQGNDPAKDAFYRAHEAFTQFFQQNHHALESLHGGVQNVSRVFNDVEERNRRAFNGIIGA
ncbi:hypothetical protein ACN94_08605 [Gordonia paraffinivorans]|nr:hypothetical protein [Gordonia paraffinivorans]